MSGELITVSVSWTSIGAALWKKVAMSGQCHKSVSVMIWVQLLSGQQPYIIYLQRPDCQISAQVLHRWFSPQDWRASGASASASLWRQWHLTWFWYGSGQKLTLCYRLTRILRIQFIHFLIYYRLHKLYIMYLQQRGIFWYCVLLLDTKRKIIIYIYIYWPSGGLMTCSPTCSPTE